MKILVDGDPNRLEHVCFECKHCGCIFEASAREYWLDAGNPVCFCPCCEREVPK